MVNRSQAWAAALLIAAVAAGGAAGDLLRGPGGASVVPRLRDTDAWVAYLTHELDLTPAEQDSVRAVLRRHRPEVDRIWRDLHPRFDSVRAVMQSEIDTKLTPAQRDRYHALNARNEQESSSDTTGTASSERQ